MDGVGGQTAQPAQGLAPRGQRFGYGAGVTECHLPLPLSTGRAHPAPFSDPQQEVLVLRWSHRRGICTVCVLAPFPCPDFTSRRGHTPRDALW